MYFYLAMVGFEHTPTTTAAPSNTETTVIPSRPLRSLKKDIYYALTYYSGTCLPNFINFGSKMGILWLNLYSNQVG